MTTALIISELLELHDDTLIADIERIFDELERTVEPTPPGENHTLLLLVDELVDELLAPDTTEQLSISLELELADTDTDQRHDEHSDEVAEVA